MAVRFAALGDSLTEGVGDPVPDGWRGWAALLAPALSDGPVDFHNLARSGTLSRDLTDRQLPQALALNPQYAAVVIGGNDTLRAGFDIGRTTRHLDTALRSLHASGTLLLTACLPDPGALLRLPQPLARPLARRMQAVNTVVHALSARYRAVHLHLAELPWQEQRFLLSVDRLHPSAVGHHVIARDFHTRLAAAGHPLGPAPAATPSAPPPGAAADLWWMATRGTRWLSARCTDLLPGLLTLAADETRHLLHGSTAQLDDRSLRATATALAHLEPYPTASPAGSTRRVAPETEQRTSPSTSQTRLPAQALDRDVRDEPHLSPHQPLCTRSRPTPGSLRPEPQSAHIPRLRSDSSSIPEDRPRPGAGVRSAPENQCGTERERPSMRSTEPS